ncbi:MAG: Crp/Fnr family transcriptional regulator [Chitinophagaceae bacterium]|nr:Crp/Fnr family transcriptional regulator [Chitinophagaceae bacterium]
MFHSIKASLSSFGQFSEQELEAITTRLQFREVKKNECLVTDGQVCRNFYFVNRGGFRHYTALENGSEAVLNLYVEKEWLFDYKSFVTQSPSANRIQAIEESEVFELSGWNFHELLKLPGTYFQIGRIFEQAIQNQDYQNNRLSPEEKYALLLSTKPQVIQKFPLKQIASYLGMTPETLSRIRRRTIS